MLDQFEEMAKHAERHPNEHPPVPDDAVLRDVDRRARRAWCSVKVATHRKHLSCQQEKKASDRGKRVSDREKLPTGSHIGPIWLYIGLPGAKIRQFL